MSSHDGQGASLPGEPMADGGAAGTEPVVADSGTVNSHPAWLCDAEYYRRACGQLYELSKHWLDFVSVIAEQIIRNPRLRRVVDAGCAVGFLVEALRDRDRFRIAGGSRD